VNRRELFKVIIGGAAASAIVRELPVNPSPVPVSEVVALGRTTGWLGVDEVRELENMPPLIPMNVPIGGTWDRDGRFHVIEVPLIGGAA
jgi:hypothetical protein